MLKAFKYRIYPTKEQTNLINKHIGSSRFIYNLALEVKKITYSSKKENISYYNLSKQLPDLKNECAWLREINSQSLQSSIKNLDIAFTRFFKGMASLPKFKKKSNKGSFSIPQKVSVKNNKLFIPKFIEGISIILHRPLKGTIRQATISKTSTNKYFVSILCDTGESINPKVDIKKDNAIGIDLGIKSYLITSDGKEYTNPKFLKKAMDKLKYINRKYSKYSGKKAKKRLSILHEKVVNKRKDFLHKLSSELIKNHDSIAIENLDITKMLKNDTIALSISDASWGTFILYLKYKAEWYGKNILQIDKFDPSSKLHNKCGHINKDLALKDREWICSNCGEKVSRDINAAINIKNFAFKKYLSGEHRLKNQNELPTLVGVLTSEV
jgi:putative transposase